VRGRQERNVPLQCKKAIQSEAGKNTSVTDRKFEPLARDNEVLSIRLFKVSEKEDLTVVHQPFLK